MPLRILRNILIALIFVIVIGTPLFYFRWGIYPYTLSKQLFFQSAVELAFFFWLALLIFSAKNFGGRAPASPRYSPRLTPFTIALGVFLAALVVTSFTGVDAWRSFWSTYERGIGVVAFLHLAAFGVIVSSLYSEIPWKKLLYASLGAAFFIDLIAFAQIAVPDLLLIENPGSRPGATFGNPAFLAGYLLFHVFLAAYLFFDAMREKKTASSVKIAPRIWFLGIATAANLAAIIIGQTRGDLIALAAGVLVLFAYFAVSPPAEEFGFLRKRSAYAALLGAVLVFASVFFFTRQSALWDRVPGLSRFRTLSLSLDSPDVAPRVFALRAAWRGFLERPFLGWGPENFTPVYDHHYDPRALEASYKETHFDKPHNFLVEYLAGGGVFLFAAFLFLFAAAIYQAFRQKDRVWQGVFLASVGAYAVGNLFLFETLGPLVMLYLFFGAADGAFRTNISSLRGSSPAGERLRQSIFEIASPSARNDMEKKIPHYIIWPCVVAAAALIYIVNIQTLLVSYYQYAGFQKFLQQDIFNGLRFFSSANAAWTPYAWNFKRDYAIAVAGQYFNYPGTVSDVDALRAIVEMEKVRDQHPEDAFNHYALVNLYNEAAAIDQGIFTRQAEEEAAKALAISPGRQEVYFYLAKTKVIEGDYAGSLTVLKKALDEDSKVPDAHFYYGLVVFAISRKADNSQLARGLMDLGYREIKTAMDMGRQWKTFYEPRTVAGFFADAGHLDEAISLYETAWGLSGRADVDTETKLAVAYFYAGRRDDAKELLEDVSKKFDFSKSPSYAQLRPILDQLGIR